MRLYHIWNITSTQSKWQQILTSVSQQRLKKNERKKKTNDVDVGQDLLLLNKESCSQTLYHRL